MNDVEKSLPESSYHWHDGRYERTVDQAVPIERLEPPEKRFKRKVSICKKKGPRKKGVVPVLPDVVNAAALIAEPLGGHFAAQALDQSLRRPAHDARELNLVDAFEDDVVRLHRIRRGERRPDRHTAGVSNRFSGERE